MADGPSSALIADVHGNLVALEAVLADIRRLEVDALICLGDVAATGPSPCQAIERVAETGCPVVMGNTDAWLLDPRDEEQEDDDWRKIHDIDSWCAEQLSEEHRALLRAYAPTVERDGLCCYHGSPRSADEELLPVTPAAELEAALAGHEAAVYAGGHTHQVMLRRHRTSIVVNPGSVGLPFELLADGSFSNPPYAEYAIVRGTDIEFRRVPLDVGAVTAAAMASGMPHASWWIRDWRWG